MNRRAGGRVAAGLVVVVLGVHTAVRAHGKTLPRDTAVLRWLDKSVARVRTITAPVGGSVVINTLRVTVRACVERPPEEPPESAAFLDIAETHPGKPTEDVFRGWMFASSPALSAMEHPVYDIWTLDCVNSAPAPQQDAAGGAPQTQ